MEIHGIVPNNPVHLGKMKEMKTTLFAVLVLILATACHKNDEPENNNNNNTTTTPVVELKATVGGEAFDADKFAVSTAVQNNNYQITAIDDPQSITMFFTGYPEVKTYTLNGKQSESGASLTWAADNLSSTTNHRMTDGKIIIESNDNTYVKGTFSGTVTSVMDSTATKEIKDGTFYVKFPK